MMGEKLPEDWEIVRLGEIFTLKNGQRPEFSEKGKFPIYGANGIMGLCDSFLVDNDFIIIFGRVGASGEVHLGKGKIWVSDNAIYTENYKKEKVYPLFVFYYLKFINLRRFATKTTHPIITQSFLNSFQIPLPPLEEQRKIAEILSTVDKAIQKVDEAIAKTERLKKGLMQELLTKGIGHKEFKDTEIGRIPKEWGVVRLEDVTIDIQQGFASGKRDENGIIQLRMNNITSDGRVVLDSCIKVPIPDNIERYLLKPGDILFNNTNSVDLIGKTAIFRGECDFCTYSNHITRIRVDKTKVVPEWILYNFIKKWQGKYFRQICVRHVGQAGIRAEDLKNTKIPLPPLPEQQKIAEILSTVDKKLELERKRKGKLERIKKGLMNNLLTGRKRVRIR